MVECYFAFVLIGNLSQPLSQLKVHNILEMDVQTGFESETSRFFYWISPNFNINLFLILLPFILIPLAWIWVKIIYPPGKFYAFVPFNRNDTATVFNATEGLFRRLDEFTEFVPFQLFKTALLEEA